MKCEIQWLLIAYFLGNIYAKNYQNRRMCVRLIARQSSDFFGGIQCSYSAVLINFIHHKVEKEKYKYIKHR